MGSKNSPTEKAGRRAPFEMRKRTKNTKDRTAANTDGLLRAYKDRTEEEQLSVYQAWIQELYGVVGEAVKKYLTENKNHDESGTIYYQFDIAYVYLKKTADVSDVYSDVPEEVLKYMKRMLDEFDRLDRGAYKFRFDYHREWDQVKKQQVLEHLDALIEEFHKKGSIKSIESLN